jgi:hypothetical protein
MSWPIQSRTSRPSLGPAYRRIFPDKDTLPTKNVSGRTGDEVEEVKKEDTDVEDTEAEDTDVEDTDDEDTDAEDSETEASAHQIKQSQYCILKSILLLSEGQ